MFCSCQLIYLNELKTNTETSIDYVYKTFTFNIHLSYNNKQVNSLFTLTKQFQKIIMKLSLRMFMMFLPVVVGDQLVKTVVLSFTQQVNNLDDIVHKLDICMVNLGKYG